MNRWLRPLLLIALLLLGGAMVTVVVSLACASRSDGNLRDREEYVRQWSDVYAALQQQARRQDPFKPMLVLGEEHGFVAAQHFGVRMSLTGRDSDCALTVDTGWPAVAMRYAATYGDGVRLTSGLRWPGKDGRFDACCGGIPTAPLPGFAINTLFYAAILALPLSVFPIRRRLRARRGRCPKCGYDLAGLADSAAPCPECGAG